MEWFHEFFSKLYHFEELIRWGGYAVLVIIIYAETGLLAGFFLPGDSLLVTAGLFAAVEGALHIEILIPLLAVAAIAGAGTSGNGQRPSGGYRIAGHSDGGPAETH